MGCCSVPGLMPLEQGLEKLLTTVTKKQTQSLVDFDSALGRVLAQDLIAACPLPNDDNSAMDGYAIKSGEENQTLEIIGFVMAGHPFDGEVKSGQAARIMTGAPMPKGADTVVMQEDCSVEDNQLTINDSVKPGQNVRLQGEDIQSGQTILQKGKLIGPADIALASAAGVAQMPVVDQIIVAMLSTGDELKQPGEPLSHGQIYDSNRPSLRALFDSPLIKIIDMGHIGDDLQATRQAFIKANDIADAVITSGGVSVGDADFVKDVLDELGDIEFWKLAIKPGKPFAYGKLKNSVFFGLPGNPVSAMVTAYQLAIPAIKVMSGQAYEPPLMFNAVSKTAFKKAPGRLDFQRGIYSIDANGVIEVQSAGGQGSHMLSALSDANCFIRIESQRGNVEVGETVIVEPMNL